jgi:hypothetical protein
VDCLHVKIIDIEDLVGYVYIVTVDVYGYCIVNVLNFQLWSWCILFLYSFWFILFLYSFFKF